MVHHDHSQIQQVCAVQPGEHFVQVYSQDSILIDCLFNYLVQGFDLSEAALVIATRPHRLKLEQKLVEAGYDISQLKRAEKYIPFDAAEVLGLFMRDGHPDPVRFQALVGGLLKNAGLEKRGVRAFGEMVSILWDEGNREGALELEKLWNDLATRHDFTLFCAYREDQFASAENRAAFSSVCAAHSTLILGSRP